MRHALSWRHLRAPRPAADRMTLAHWLTLAVIAAGIVFSGMSGAA